MRRKLLISGVTLGACVLTVSLVMSSAPSVLSTRTLPGTSPVPVNAADAAVKRSTPPSANTATNQILVSLHRTAKHPQRTASKAVAPAAARIAKAQVVATRVRYTGTVVVVLNKQVSRTQATGIAHAASRASGVDYAEPSLTFYPTDVSAPVGSDAWNRVAIGADNLASDDTGSGVVVGVIDTGIAANPDLPKALLVNAVNGVVNNRTITGTTWPGLVVTATWNGKRATTTADGSGNWAFAFDAADATTPVPQDGDQVRLSVTDVATTNVDVTVDAVVVLTLKPSNGKTLSGTSEKGASVVATFNGQEVCRLENLTEADFSCTPTVSLANGDVVTVTATDAVANTTSAQVTIDTIAPATPTIDLSNGKTIHLTGAETGITPQAFTAETGGTLIDGTWTAGPATGEWTFTPTTDLTEDTPTWIRLTDPATNTTSTPVTIDTLAPTAPTVHATDGDQLSGTAEANAVITVSYRDTDNAAQVATVTVNDDGTWSTTLNPRAGDRSELTATATDAVGNISDPSEPVRVHYGPPSVPSVAPSNGDTVLVSAVLPTDTVTLVDAGGTSLGSCVDNTDQTWTCTPDPALSESDQAFVIVTDDSGQSSEPAAVVVDTTDPTVAIDTATPTAASGTSNEALASLTVSYVDTADQTHTATATITDSTWSATLVDAKIGSTITITGTDLAGNHSQASATVAEPPSEPSSPTPDPQEGAGTEPESVDHDATVTESESGRAANLNTSANGGTVLPGYNFYGSISGNHNATDPGVDPARRFHGTHVAGIIAAGGASQITGVAPGVKILPIRVLGGTGSGGDLADVSDAISWGAGVASFNEDGSTKDAKYPRNPYPAKVLNLSLGATSNSCPLAMQKSIDAAVAKGTTVVVSAGNNNSSITGQAPANCKNVIVVTASTATKTRARYSNWGVPARSGASLIAAPGGSGSGECYLGGDCSGFVMSTTGLIGTVDGTVFNSYSWPMAGTSQAAPHVSAVAALLLAKNSGLSPKNVADALRASATPFADGCPTGVCGSGIVNAAAALDQAGAGGDSGPPDTGVPAAAYPSAWVRLYQPSTPRVGMVLRAAGAVSYGATSFQWYRGTAAIARATSARYTMTSADLGQRIKVRVSGVGWNVAYSRSSLAVARGNVVSISRPQIIGTRKVGQRLRATKGTWSVATTVYRYRWYRNGKAIKGATSRKYRLTWADRGKRITVRVSVKASGYYSRNRVSDRTATIH